MRDYVIIAAVLGSLPVGLFRPFYGLLVYAWISYMYPQDLAWSFAQTFPVAKLSALSVMAGLIFSPTGRFGVVFKRENMAMLLLAAMFTVSSLFAFYPDRAWGAWQDTSKVIVMSLLASMLLTDRTRVRQFVLVIALSLGFYGFKGGLFGLITRGQDMVFGPGDSIIGANNNLGLALNMCLPLLWYLAYQERGWRRRVLQAIFFLTIPAIMFTYSRGSAATMAVLLLIMILKSRRRFVLIFALATAGIFALPFVPQKWLDRQQTIVTYEEDDSAMSRIDNWKFCWTLALDRPLTGAGFEFQSREVFEKYAPEFIIKYRGKVWDTHNIFLSILASHGFPGLLAFISMIAFSLLSCTQLKRTARKRPDLNWVPMYAEMIQLSLVAFLINGMFVNMEYFDLPYHWIAVVVSLRMICKAEVAQSEPATDFIEAPTPATA